MRACEFCILGVVLLFSAEIGAETIPERVTELEKRLSEQGKSIGAALGIDIHGLVAADYLYNFNDPDSRTNQVRVFDEDANSFTLNQANLWIGRQREDESLGFVLNMDFGDTAEVVGRATRWSNGDSSESDNSFELREAFLTYRIPIGGGVLLKAGKFVTLHGAEVIKNYNALNYTVSNSILFGYAIPFTHTGIMFSLPMGDMFAADIGVVNGWDNVADNNDGKSLHTGLKIAPSEDFSLYLAATIGPEQTDNGHSKRYLGTALATYNATERLTFILDADAAMETDTPEPVEGMFAGGERDTEWYGAAAYAIYKVDERLSFTLRGEVFNDPDGVRTLADPDGPGVGHGPGAFYWEITPSVSYQLTKGLLARAEYRHDQADAPVYEHHDTFQDGQDTIAAELIYAF